MEFFSLLAENRIREAMEAGEFDDLQGKGQPLNLEDDSHIPSELRMAYKILKNADCLPPELTLRQEVVNCKTWWPPCRMRPRSSSRCAASTS